MNHKHKKYEEIINCLKPKKKETKINWRKRHIAERGRRKRMVVDLLSEKIQARKQRDNM